jgi:hypothetical protein
MNEQKLPERVVRFYGNTDYALECIALKQITSIHLEKMNDPFDLKLDFFTDFNDDYESLLACVKEHYPKQLRAFKQRYPKASWAKTVASWAKMERETRRNVFIFSACAVEGVKHPKNNLYMWSHYANGHRGVAIEFNAPTVSEAILEQDNSNITDVWCKMLYNNKIPAIKCEDVVEHVIKVISGNPKPVESKLTRVIKERIFLKSEFWKSENEWRLIRENDETKLKIYRDELPNDAITAVYLGCIAAEQEKVRKDFVYETRRHFPNAKVFKATMRRGEFALEFKPIS